MPFLLFIGLNGFEYLSLLLFSCQVTPHSLRPHGRQYARFPCLPLSPRVCSSSWPFSWQCYLTNLLGTRKSSVLQINYLIFWKWKIFVQIFLLVVPEVMLRHQSTISYINWQDVHVIRMFIVFLCLNPCKHKFNFFNFCLGLDGEVQRLWT